MSLYEEHDLNFIIAVFQIYHAYVECSGEIYSINVFDIFSSRFLYGTQKNVRSDRAEFSWHSN